MNKKTYDHQQLISIHEIGLDIKNREIYLHSDTSTSEEEGVEYKSAIRFEKNIRILESISKEAILVHMHLPGGDWSDCFGIYDTIKSCKSRIIILAYAKVESSSSIILQAADTRILMPNCHVLIHYGSVSLDHDHLAATSTFKWSAAESEKMVNIFASKCLLGPMATKKNWKKVNAKKHIQAQLANQSDWILSAEQSVDYGFADAVLGDSSFPTINSIKYRYQSRKKKTI